MLPATSPESTLSDAPPSREDMTTSRTWADSVEVKILTASGMIAPARVPQLMIAESFHHRSVLPATSGMRSFETMKVITTLMIEVSHTRFVSGASKFILSALP